MPKRISPSSGTAVVEQTNKRIHLIYPNSDDSTSSITTESASIIQVEDVPSVVPVVTSNIDSKTLSSSKNFVSVESLVSIGGVDIDNNSHDNKSRNEENDTMDQNSNNEHVEYFCVEDTIEDEEVDCSITTQSKQLGDFRTGIVTETGSMHFDRYNRFHIERPKRIESIMEGLKDSDKNLAVRCCHVDNHSEGPFFLDEEDFLRVHMKGYIQRFKRFSSNSCKCCSERLDAEAEQYTSVYLTQDSFQESKKAAASLCRLVSDVMTDKLDNGFAIIRPPGHHAEPQLAGGFCILNNVAVAAAYARHKLNAKKVLIVDWDVHHGNGTQSIFYDDPNVLYFSIHRHQSSFYPFTKGGSSGAVGGSYAQGFNINVAWSHQGMGDNEYIAVWEKILMPVAREFKPDLILVSAGFDAARGDLGQCDVTPECFARLTRSLMTIHEGQRLVCALEGGYKQSVLSRCVQEVVNSLLDRNSLIVSQMETNQSKSERTVQVDVLDTINKYAANDILATIQAHKLYWNCLVD